MCFISFWKVNYSPEGWETSPLTTSEPKRCSWTHAWLVELSCRPSQFPWLCVSSVWGAVDQNPLYMQYTLNRSFFWSLTSLSASCAWQIYHSLWILYFKLVRAKVVSDVVSDKLGNSNWTVPYSWPDLNSGTVHGFLQDIEEDNPVLVLVEHCKLYKQG